MRFICESHNFFYLSDLLSVFIILNVYKRKKTELRVKLVSVFKRELTSVHKQMVLHFDSKQSFYDPIPSLNPIRPRPFKTLKKNQQ